MESFFFCYDTCSNWKKKATKASSCPNCLCLHLKKLTEVDLHKKQQQKKKEKNDKKSFFLTLTTVAYFESSNFFKKSFANREIKRSRTCSWVLGKLFKKTAVYCPHDEFDKNRTRETLPVVHTLLPWLTTFTADNHGRQIVLEEK